MRSVSAAWIAYDAANNKFVVADLYTVTPQDGTAPLKWTDYDADLLGFSSAGPTITRETARQTSGGETATLTINLGCGDTFVLPNGQKLQLAAAQGWLRYAQVLIQRLYMPTPGDTSLGAFSWFAGVVAQAKTTTTTVTLTVKSGVEFLREMQLPRRLFQPMCPHALYGAACGVLKSPATIQAQAGSGVASVIVNRTDATGTWDLGTLQFTSGALAGVHRQVATSTLSGATNVLALTSPLPSAPVAGVSAQLLAGCDKRFTTCGTKFSNANRFGGFLWIPKPESIR